MNFHHVICARPWVVINMFVSFLTCTMSSHFVNMTCFAFSSARRTSIKALRTLTAGAMTTTMKMRPHLPLKKCIQHHRKITLR